MKLLREAGDFPNKSIVEYATVRIDMPCKLVPSNLKDEGYNNNDNVSGLYVSPTGRITYKTLYLNSIELAEQFIQYLHTLFKNRPYAQHYTLRLEVTTTSQKVTATKGKLKHSAQVAEVLSCASTGI